MVQARRKRPVLFLHASYPFEVHDRRRRHRPRHSRDFLPYQEFVARELRFTRPKPEGGEKRGAQSRGEALDTAFANLGSGGRDHLAGEAGRGIIRTRAN